MKQLTALNILKQGHNVFITGSAGTGKTYLLQLFIQYLHERQIYPTVVAPTGIAASHLKGQTIHSFFALGIRDTVVDNGYVEFLLKKSYLKSRFIKLKILIIDEVSMVSPEIFSSMDKILRAFKNSPKPFGGVQVVISGDFFQLPPVSREPKEKRFSWQSPAWKQLDLRSCYLDEKFRQKDNRLIKILDEIREANISQESRELLNERYLKELTGDNIATRLYTHNMDVDRINLNELNNLPTSPYLFKFTSKGTVRGVEKIFKTAMILEELILKKDAVVIFTKNNPEKNYVNGTTGVVIGFEIGVPLVKTSSGDIIRVVAEDWTIENDKNENLATVTQIPLRLAWAITIHKSQGMTLDAAEIDLSKTFEVGQGYVALSRIKDIEGLRLMGLNEMALTVDPLILRIDNPIKKASQRAIEEMEALTEKQSDEKAMDYISFLGGLIGFVAIEDERKRIEAGVRKDTTPTYIKTKHLIEKSKSLKALSKHRNLKQSTIITHLIKLKEEDSSLDIEKFKPSAKVLKPIQKVIRKLISEKKSENFSESGKLKVRPILDVLKGKATYDNINLALLFTKV